MCGHKTDLRWPHVVRMLSLAWLCLLTSSCGYDAPHAMNIPAGPAAQTLKEFSRQAQVQIVFDARSVEGVTTNAIQGRLSPADALERMVRGTPLVVRPDNGTGAFAIIRREPSRSSTDTPGHIDLALGGSPESPLPSRLHPNPEENRYRRNL